MRRSVQRILTTVSILTLLVGACSESPTNSNGTVVAALRSADGLVDAVITLESDWGAGYRAKVTLTGTSSNMTTGWTVVIALNGGQMTGCDLDTASPALPSTGPVTVRNKDWNGALSSSRSQSFGFNGAGSGRPTILSVTQTGASGGAGGAPGSAGAPGAAGTPNTAGASNTAGAPGNPPPAAGGAPATGTGRITREVWNNVTGTSVAQIPVGAAPSATSSLTSFEVPSNAGDSYGQRVRGFIVPPTSGAFTFWIAGDDNVELYLSPDATAARKQRIAFHTSFTGSREWNKFASQKSAPVQLAGGARYYVEALMKEGSGGDNLAVGWARPGQSTAAPSEVIPGSALAPFTAGGGGSGGSAGTSGTAGSGSGSGAGPNLPPIQTGCNGYATRFWDCCKPHCGWRGNVPGGMSTMNSCSAANAPLSSFDVQSSCAGGSAHTCYGLAPFAVNANLAYGYAATSNGDVCGRCYQLQFTGGSHNAGNDPGSRALLGKTMVIQAINVGFDVGGGQFDLLVPGGGVGQFNACSAQWGVSTAELGAQFGGFLASCKQQLGFNASLDAYKSCVSARCASVFQNRGLTELAAGCRWFVDWFHVADNPALKYREVACPAELRSKSGMNRTLLNDVSNACGN